MNFSENNQRISLWRLMLPLRRFARRLQQNASDRLSALIYAIQRCDRIYDPVQTYKDELSFGVESTISLFDSRIAENERRLSSAKEYLTKLIAIETETAQSDIAFLAANLKANEVKLDQVTKGAIPDFADAKKEFERWRAAVGRPPYFERFEALFQHSALASRHEASEANTDRDNSDQAADPKSFSTRLVHFFGVLLVVINAFFPVIAVPADIAFTFPSFEFLLQGHAATAWAAAALFTIALVVLGEALGVFLTRIRRHRLEDDGKNTNRILSTFDYQSVATVAVLMIAALLCSDVGASLRSLVPQANKYNLEKRLLNDEELRIGRPPTFGVDAYATERASLPRRKLQLEQDRVDSLKRPIPFWATVDGQVAFAIYSILIFSVAIRRAVIADPIFEYGLIALHYGQVLRDNASSAIVIASIVASRKVQLHKLENRLASLKTIPTSASDNVDQKSKYVADLVSKIEEDKTDRENYKRDADHLLRTRARRFGKYYFLFRIGLPSEAASVIRRHLAND